MREEIYRGYSIRYDLRGTWTAQIRRPGGYVVMRDGFITATTDEGEQILLKRARERIDQEEKGNVRL
jgi:hypothetical protein